MIGKLRQMLVGTSLELPVRKLQVAINSRIFKLEDKNCLYDIQTLEVMKRVLRKDSNCVDVGCHNGSILKTMLRLAPNGYYFAFEPLPEMHQSLAKSFGKVTNLKLSDSALSDTEGTTTFQHVLSNPGYSGATTGPTGRSSK